MEDVDLGGGKFACANALFEQHAQLGKGATIGFGETEVGVDDAEEADSALRKKKRLAICTIAKLYMADAKLTQKKPV